MNSSTKTSLQKSKKILSHGLNFNFIKNKNLGLKYLYLPLQSVFGNRQYKIYNNEKRNTSGELSVSSFYRYVE